MSGSDNPLGGESTVHPGRKQPGATNRVVDPTDMPLPTYTYGADFDPASIEPRCWIMRYLLLRNYVTAAVGPGGVGKSTVSLVMAISVALGRDLIGYEIPEQANVLVLNNEDDSTEIDRRVAAICQYHDIPFKSLEDRLHILSGYGESFMVAEKNINGTVSATANVQKLIDFGRVNNIGFVVVDPLISTHDVDENDNTQMEKVFGQFRHIAKELEAAVLLDHHTRKAGGSSMEDLAGNIDISRGAKALTDGVRIAFTLIPMSKNGAAEREIDWNLGKRLVRIDDAKMNYTLKNDEETWLKLESLTLPNGDSVGVPVPFDMAEISKQAEDRKAEEKAYRNEIRVIEVAKQVAECMTEDKQPQAEVIGAYRMATSKGKTTANDALAILPIGMENSIKVMVGSVRTSVWRERHGNKNRPYYTVHKLTEE